MDSVRTDPATTYDDDAQPKETRSEMLSRHSYSSPPPSSRSKSPLTVDFSSLAFDWISLIVWFDPGRVWFVARIELWGMTKCYEGIEEGESGSFCLSYSCKHETEKQRDTYCSMAFFSLLDEILFDYQLARISRQARNERLTMEGDSTEESSREG